MTPRIGGVAALLVVAACGAGANVGPDGRSGLQPNQRVDCADAVSIEVSPAKQGWSYAPPSGTCSTVDSAMICGDVNQGVQQSIVIDPVTGERGCFSINEDPACSADGGAPDAGAGQAPCGCFWRECAP